MAEGTPVGGLDPAGRAASPDLDEVKAWLVKHPFNTWLGLEVVSLTPVVRLRLPIAEHLRYISGMMHGGITATLLDTALGIAARLSLTNQEAARTTALEVRYLKPGRGDVAVVEATASAVDGVAKGHGAVSIDGVRVAEGDAVFAVVSRRKSRTLHG